MPTVLPPHDRTEDRAQSPPAWPRQFEPHLEVRDGCDQWFIVKFVGRQSCMEQLPSTFQGLPVSYQLFSLGRVCRSYPRPKFASFSAPDAYLLPFVLPIEAEQFVKAPQ